MSAGWREVRAELARRIAARDWAPGARMPNEDALAGELGCARGTVNRAMRALAEEGIVERRRRAGTRVASVPVRRAVMRIPILRREIEAAGAAPGYRRLLREEAPVPAEVAARLGVPAGVRLLRVDALHLADGAPWALERRWIDPRAAPGAAEEPFEAVSANEWLVRHVPLTRGALSIGAEGADAADAEALGCAAGAPVLTLRRTTWGAAGAVTDVRQVFAPGHAMRAEI